ncbi:sigma-54 interaction domain-containing protein [Sandaracinus amylolyticus]|uniref:sigma-54 interaction domain-containing protein n=1 Tax=Sandaracinus amylolyticus TaxID=927083 RepID=UPI001F03023A|nr:sigma 54-interacting transcriptional regulator [Sandaracinus amylolyticus]
MFFAQALAPIAELLLHRNSSELPDVTHESAFSGIVSRSPLVRRIVEQLRLVAPLDVHVLLTGQSGTGKTLFANAIHAASNRRHRPFVEINCAAIPESLLENELFGADPGAHSAVPRGGVRGKVEAAEGGTLFLDEIGELALSSQAKLLQLLQDRTYYRLGSTNARRADVRIIAATNVALPTAVAQRRFREDLFYRLKVFEARIPSLAERIEDVIPLAVHFCRSAARRHELEVSRLSPEVLRTLAALEWPGNVRELANRIESAVLHAHMRGVGRVEVRDLFPTNDAVPGQDETLTLQEATRRFQRAHVLAILESTDWNITETARQLDVARSYVYTLIRVHGLHRET